MTDKITEQGIEARANATTESITETELSLWEKAIDRDDKRGGVGVARPIQRRLIAEVRRLQRELEEWNRPATFKERCDDSWGG